VAAAGLTQRLLVVSVASSRGRPAARRTSDLEGHRVTGRLAIRMTEEEIDDFLDSHLRASMGTVNRDGSIHLVPLHYARFGSQLLCWTDPGSQKAVNLRRDPRISALVEDGGPFEERRGVSMSGTAEVVVDDVALALEVGRGMVAKWPQPVAQAARDTFLEMAAVRAVVRMTPERVLSWDHRKLAGATREDLGR